MTRKQTRLRWRALALLLVSALVLAACGDDGSEGGDGDLTSSDDPITVLIGSSGDAETNAVKEAVAAWSAESGVQAEVLVATDLGQELAQGFASGEPADLFYMSPDQLVGFAANGSVKAYGKYLDNKDDFYEALVNNFTVDGEFYCAPKDFSTLALIINDAMWEEAGLTADDYPTTWEELTDVARKVTTDDHVGLAFGAEWQRIGVFMAEAGGALVENGNAVANSDANVQALQYVKDALNEGIFAYAADIDAGWGGDAFGKQVAAMVIEGNWITGFMRNDHPDISYTVVELPAGPAGKGTLQYTNCWGMAADSPNQQAALDLVEYLTSAEQMLKFAEAFGPMPAVKSAADQWKQANPSMVAFLDGAEYAQWQPVVAGIGDVIGDFNAQLGQLKTADPKAILDQVQSNLEAILSE
ncbi:MAG: extracellular solute-binding protein [Actinomycetes bacterium]|jgi:multiple sugar transport system substrate-binding protein|nr:MAG: ABC transporter substrate-binding protein [Actinomycetota bacterium]